MTAHTDAATTWQVFPKRLIRSLRRILHPSSRKTNQVDCIAASPLFDSEWYVTRYPDVALAGINPAHHYTLFGEAEGRDAGPLFSATIYAERHPEVLGAGSMLLHAQRHGQADHGRPPSPPLEVADIPNVDTLLRQRFPDLRPLPIFAAPHIAPRLSLVVDRIDSDSLRRGIGTAIVLAALTAMRIGATLRIVTRIEPPDAADVAAVLDGQRIDWPGNIDFVHAPSEGGVGVPVGSGDLFMVTSWWTVAAVKLSVPRERIAYLVQEDERSLYPIGDDRLRCSEALRDPGVVYIAGSEVLLRSLQTDGLAPGGIALGPFPDTIEHLSGEALVVDRKRRFLLSASPSVPGNLYWRGLEALSEAIASGVLDPAVWDFHLTGAATHDLGLAGGVRPTLLDGLPWADYVTELRNMDLVLSPLEPSRSGAWPDPLACGAVVVTTRCGLDYPLDQQRPRLIRCEPGVESLVDALRKGARLAIERPRRETTGARPELRGRWGCSASAAIDRLADWAGH